MMGQMLLPVQFLLLLFLVTESCFSYGELLFLALRSYNSSLGSRTVTQSWPISTSSSLAMMIGSGIGI